MFAMRPSDFFVAKTLFHAHGPGTIRRKSVLRFVGISDYGDLTRFEKPPRLLPEILFPPCPPDPSRLLSHSSLADLVRVDFARLPFDEPRVFVESVSAIWYSAFLHRAVVACCRRAFLSDLADGGEANITHEAVVAPWCDSGPHSCFPFSVP